MNTYRDQAKERGLTLLELMVAVFVLALGSMAALRSVDQSRLAIGGAQDRILAQLAVRNHAEALQIAELARALPDTVTLGGQTLSLRTVRKTTSAGLTEAEVFASTPSGASARLVVYLPPKR